MTYKKAEEIATDMLANFPDAVLLKRGKELKEALIASLMSIN